ncbi:MAG: hypothetical protein ABSC06_13345 [Rhodopila sp.]|jgi:hypothetical protein
MHLILHHHIFKNAGSTLDFSLAAQFGTAFAHLENERKYIREKELGDFVDRNIHIKAISSHNFYGAGFEQALGVRGYCAFNLALVRRPFQRLLSIYKYFRRIPVSSDLIRAAVQLDFAGFVQLLIDQYPHMVDNPQVNTLANHGFYRRAVSEDDLEVAWARYNQFALCAPVERYDDAMVVLEYFNSPVYAPGGLNMAYIRQNVSEALSGTNEVDQLILGEDREWLIKSHRFDQCIWELANTELDRRIAIVPKFESRLADFKERCRRLEGTATRNSDASRLPAGGGG